MFLRPRILLDNAPVDGGDNTPAPTDTPAPGVVTPGPSQPAAPPATKIVVEGTKTEREIELERQRDEALAARKKAETDASYHQSEAQRLREIQSAPAPQPKAKQVQQFGFFTREVEGQ